MTRERKKITIVSFFIILLIICLCVGTTSCDFKKAEPAPGISFSKIYDKPDYFSYTAVDIKQLPDGGYIILGMVDSHPYLLRIDSDGNAMWDTKADDFFKYKMGDDGQGNPVYVDFIDPVADIIVLNQEYYFFCSVFNHINKLKYMSLLKLSEADHSPEVVDLSLNIPFYTPMSARKSDDGQIIMFAIHEFTFLITLRKVDSDGLATWKNEGSRYEGVCTYTFPLTDKRYNFIEAVKNTGNTIYKLHGYLPSTGGKYPSCFGIKAFDTQDGSWIGETYELPLPNAPYIAAEWNDDKLTGARIDSNAISFILNSEPDIEENERSHLELITSRNIYVKTIGVSGKTVTFFVGSAKNNRIVLYAYDPITRDLINKKYFGYTHIYEASALIKTGADGLAILGTTYVTGRLGRICLFKLSQLELENMVR